MEINMMSVTCCVFALAALISSTLSIPIDTQGTDDSHLEEKRPKYMDTRDLDFFKDLVMISLQKLAQDNKINKFVLMTDSEESEEETGNDDSGEERITKKNRHLRLCLRRNGRSYIPYPCWRRG